MGGLAAVWAAASSQKNPRSRSRPITEGAKTGLGRVPDAKGAPFWRALGTLWHGYGVPEIFVISKDGHIAHKHIGPLSSGAIEGTILPLIRRLQEQ